MLEKMRENISEIRQDILELIGGVIGFTWIGFILTILPLVGHCFFSWWVIPLNKMLLTLFGENFVSKWAFTTDTGWVCNSSYSYYETVNTCLRLAVFWSVFFLIIGIILLLLSLFIRKKTK